MFAIHDIQIGGAPGVVTTGARAIASNTLSRAPAIAQRHHARHRLGDRTRKSSTRPVPRPPSPAACRSTPVNAGDDQVASGVWRMCGKTSQ
jgi:hypothetical protein